MKILACQLSIPSVTSKVEKTEHLRKTAQKVSAQLKTSATHPDLVVLPELSSIDYSRESFGNLAELAEELDGESFSIFSKLAANFGVYIAYGMPRVEADTYYISQVVVNDKGELVGYYDKLHIAQFGASMEKEYFERGKKLLVFEVGGIKVSPIICYDLRFPELYRELCVTQGVDLIIHPVAFYRDESFPSWHHFSITRAMENQAYVLSLNRAGENYGSSIFCPPWIDEEIQPTVFPRAESFQEFEISTETLMQAQKIFPFRADALENYDSLD